MRIFLLCTSYHPLTLYLQRSGFCRFTHTRYNNNDFTDTNSHITNVAIQKTSKDYNADIGGKWDLRKLKLYLISKYGTVKVSKCFHLVQELMIECLKSVKAVMINDK